MAKSSLVGIVGVFCMVAAVVSVTSSCGQKTSAPVAAAKNVPAPPTAVGCYNYSVNSAGGSAGQWAKTACLSRAKASRLPHLQIGGQSNGVYGLNAPCQGPCDTNPNSLITAGLVAISFPTSNAIAEPVSAENDNSAGSFSFSVQLNTNTFPVTCNPGFDPSGQNTGQNICIGGHQGWVQFGYQANPGCEPSFGQWLSNLLDCGATSVLCVWANDVTPGIPATYYPDWCINPPDPYENIVWSNGSAPANVLQISAGVLFSAPDPSLGQLLWTMACVPWVIGAPQCFGVVAPDELGLCWDPSSNQCAWQTLSGSLLGYGGASHANFSPGVTMVTTVVATACTQPFPAPFGLVHPWPAVVVSMPPPTPLQCPWPGSPTYYVQAISAVETGEMNNLTPTLSPASEVVGPCLNGTCWITYTASD
jgi:hypothetical protein